MNEALIAIIDALPYILKGTGVTAGIVIGAMGLGLLAGIPMAAGQVYGRRPVRFLIGLYVWFFRGVPGGGGCSCCCFWSISGCSAFSK